MIGRNFAYRPIVLKDSDLVLGKNYQVKISDVKPTSLSVKYYNNSPGQIRTAVTAFLLVPKGDMLDRYTRWTYILHRAKPGLVSISC
ncbi:MAG: hypothetical protein Ct9H300mP24_8340 [Candidatus Neomarinimicrobiota bacterium]|nr:MAG: hypothetical protein Ct9H300mP24_8340 [Candidatus Neomarinimicrobiota bacterium]